MTKIGQSGRTFHMFLAIDLWQRLNINKKFDIVVAECAIALSVWVNY